MTQATVKKEKGVRYLELGLKNRQICCSDHGRNRCYEADLSIFLRSRHFARRNNVMYRAIISSRTERALFGYSVIRPVIRLM